MELISSHSNPKIKQARALRQRKARQESGLFIIEGIRHVGEAVEAQAHIAYLLYAPGRLHSAYAQDLIQQLSAREVPCYPVSDEVFATVADKENPPGLLAVAHLPNFELADFNPTNFPWGVAIVDPQDPGNLGSILRTIDAVGASGLLLLCGETGEGLVDPFHPSALRASMGAHFWRPLAAASFAEFATWAKAHAYHIYGTSAHGAVDYREIQSFHRPAILLLGSERAGLTPLQSEICEQLIRLPMHGRATSLNLAVAAGVFLYEMLANNQSLSA